MIRSVSTRQHVQIMDTSVSTRQHVEIMIDLYLLDSMLR